MAADTMIFPEFVANQVLTNKQLNNMRDYLDRQERLTRVRLTGVGIVCGLNVTRKADSISISAGFGIASDGDIIEIPAPAEYTHYRTYTDPDHAADGTPAYEQWRKGDTGQIEIYELLDKATATAEDCPGDPKPLAQFQVLTKQDLTEHRVALYLEHQPQDLGSCLIMDCSNRGKNVRLNVRALLLPAESQAGTTTQPATLTPVRVSRLDWPLLVRRLGDSNTSRTLDQLYDAIVEYSMGEVLSKIEALANSWHAKFLDVTLKANKPNVPHGQYGYDCVKDLADAYNEALAAVQNLIPTCAPPGGFPRHLVLSDLAAGADQPLRNRFVPSPVRNVMHGELCRARQLFQRLEQLLEAVRTTKADEVRIAPSHTELHALGARAIPFYYGEEFYKNFHDLWRAGTAPGAGEPWSYYGETESDLVHDYTRCSLLRIEGHVGHLVDVVGHLESWRKEFNLEVEVVTTHLGDPVRKEADAFAAAMELVSREREFAEKSIAAVRQFLSVRQSQAKLRKEMLDFARSHHEIITGIYDRTGEWAQLRGSRQLVCDVSALEADYSEIRAGLRCRLHGLAGCVRRMAERVCTLIPGGITAQPRIRLFAQHLLPPLSRQVALKIGLHPDTAANEVDNLKDLLGSPKYGATLLRGFLDAVDVVVDRVTELSQLLPKHLSQFNYQLFLTCWKEATTDALFAGLLDLGIGLAAAGWQADAPQGRWGGPQHLDSAELFGFAQDCALPKLAALSARYEAVRAADYGVFLNLVRSVSGMEHSAGVEKGGTFIMVCESQGEGKPDAVVADFSLSGKLPRCCDRDRAVPAALPVMALPDYRVTRLVSSEKGYDNVILRIPVLSNDFDLEAEGKNVAVPLRCKIDLEGKNSELGAELSVDENDGTIVYSFSNPKPGIDWFTYACAGAGESGRATVALLLVPAPEPGGLAARGLDSTGAALPSVAFTLRADEATVQEKIADASGVALFTGLPAGIYTLGFKVKGYWGDSVDVEIMAGSTTTADVNLRAVDYRRPPDYDDFVAGRKQIDKEAAKALVERVYGSRYEARYTALEEAGKDAKVKESPAYGAALDFLRDAGGGDPPDDRLAALYKSAAGSLVKAIRAGGEDLKTPLRTVLATVTLGLLDRLTLSNREGLSAAATGAIQYAAKSLKAAGIPAESVTEAWNGASLTQELGTEVPSTINAQLR